MAEGRFLRPADPAQVLALVVAGSPGQANDITLRFKADQLAAKLDTLAVYNDKRQDFDGQLAELLGDDKPG